MTYPSASRRVTLLIRVSALDDLAASAVKRHYGVKDFGRTLGAMGGILDRIDSLLGAGWIFWLLLQQIG